MRRWIRRRNSGSVRRGTLTLGAALGIGAAFGIGAALPASAPAGWPSHAAAGALKALPGQPEGTTTSLVPSFSPDRLGAAAALTLNIDYAGVPHRVPAPVRNTVVHLPAGLSFHMQSVSTCSHAGVSRGSCPASSRVGAGSDVAVAHLGSQTLSETASASAYRGPNQGGHPTLLIASQGLTPLIERVVITAVLQRDRPPYGLELQMSVPPIPTLPTEPNASILRFTLTIGGGHGPRGVVQTPHSCPAGGFPFGADFTFTDGSTASSTATARCP